MYLRHDLLQIIFRQHPAIHTENIFTGNGVDVSHVGFLFRRFKGALRWIKERIGVGKYFSEFDQFGNQVGCGDKSVIAEVRIGAVALISYGFKTQPEHALFGDFDERALGIARIGNHNQIILTEKIFGRINHVMQTLVARGFFIRNKGKFNRRFRRDSFIHERFNGKDGSDHVLLIVFYAATENVMVFHVGLIGIMTPEAQLAGGNNIHVGNNPDEFIFVFPLEGRDKIGPDTGGHS